MSQTLVTVDFHGQSLVAVLIDGQPYVAMQPICENIGLQWGSQYNRIQRNPVLQSTIFMTNMVAEDGKQREMVCLPLDMLNGWLFGVDVNRVREEIRPKLMQYQKECFGVLFRHFMPQQTDKTAQAIRLSGALEAAGRIGARVQAEAFELFMRDEQFDDGRWLLSFVRDEHCPDKLRPHVKRLEPGTYVTTLRRLADNMSDPASMHKTEDLAHLARACLAKLERRAAYASQLEIAAHRAKTAPSANPNPPQKRLV